MLMQAPVLRGVVRRRILVNFRVDPEAMQRQLPPPFRPQLVDGCAVAGICLIRLEQIRPVGVPAALGVCSENAAHRVAVTWMDRANSLRQGVYIPRRDTGSLLNHLAGGRIFPGEHHRARFRVRDHAGAIDLVLESEDGSADVRLRARESGGLPSTSAFPSLQAASDFFAGGSVGYSAVADSARLDGLELRTLAWRVDALEVESVFSAYYADSSRFPPGSVAFDSALVMRDIPHEWHPVPTPTALDPVLAPCT
jgi:hypothetical protein